MMAAGCGPAYLPLLYFYELVYLLAIEIVVRLSNALQSCVGIS
jgi:hypothetical protein